MILECPQNFTGNGSLITSDNKLSSDYEADIKDMHPSLCPFWLFTILLPLWTRTQCTLCLSPLSYQPNLFLFPLHLPVWQYSDWVLSCGSCSFISLSELSGACCLETANIRDVVINGSMKAPPCFSPRGPTHSPPSFQTTLAVSLYICQEPNGPQCCNQSS